MKCISLQFKAPYAVDFVDAPVSEPAEDMLLVRTRMSAISAGTEMLVYRGQVPGELALDPSISALTGRFAYPVKYGYALVGQVETAGNRIDPKWVGRTVFAFHPHETLFAAGQDEVIPIPESISAENALFLPNMETAVNFIMDARPMIGEQVIVFGQGIVGQLTTALLSRFPLKNLVTLDRYAFRREKSLQAGAGVSLDPNDAEAGNRIKRLLANNSPDATADLIFELSGNPAALDQAIELAGYNSRIVIGSWYGTRKAALNLGGAYHRNRIQLISSQVSTLAPELLGRWSKARRFECAWEMIRQVQPAELITQRFKFADAANAFDLLDRQPENALQIVLNYDEGKDGQP